MHQKGEVVAVGGEEACSRRWEMRAVCGFENIYQTNHSCTVHETRTSLKQRTHRANAPIAKIKIRPIHLRWKGSQFFRWWLVSRLYFLVLAHQRDFNLHSRAVYVLLQSLTSSHFFGALSAVFFVSTRAVRVGLTRFSLGKQP